ncbi:cupredoxin family copper-binding protein [Nocardia higoensis]|uniref:Cupredoxin family copper-binding protein n=1 Tax=Nocardia higoensis TaxID=228599 RepID=A0ABS0DCM0_9NOCA|nr:cupredoxin family copper-binding protein [Nocardia higoensis]MBF6356217.1 cupredoxin family copper-binding protein [Nocardia higoensis]
MPILHRPSRARVIAALVLTASAVLAGCGSGDTDPVPATASTSVSGGTGAPVDPSRTAGAAAVTVNVDDMAFSPANVSVRVGDTVTWIFADSVPHSVQGIGDKAMGINSPILTAGEWSYTFTVPGEYRYLCSLHPDMRATVTVE